MNLENIKIGQEFKNYKELCITIEEKVCNGGTAKIAQLKEWSRYFNFSRKGYGYIIEEIYETRLLPNNTCNRTKYKNTLDLIIMDYLETHKIKTMTRRECYKQFGFVDSNYYNYDTINNWSKIQQGCNKRVIDEILHHNNCKFYEVLSASLERLYSQRLISYYADIIYVVNFDNTTREATDEEIEQILSIQRRSMLELGYEFIDMVYINGHTQKYFDMCNSLMEREMNLKQAYSCIKFIYDDKSSEFILTPENRTQIKTEFNTYINEALKQKHRSAEQYHYNLIQRQKAEAVIGTKSSKEEQYKSACYPENYIDLADNFNDTFVKLKEQSIKE